MSVNDNALPLPAKIDIIASNGEMSAAWDDINHWFELLGRQETVKKKKQALREVTGHIMLALKTISEQLKKIANSDVDRRPRALIALRCVVDALKLMRSFGVVQEIFRWEGSTSLSVAVDSGRAVWKKVSPEALVISNNVERLRQLSECHRIWRNISYAYSSDPQAEVIKGKDIKTRLSRLTTLLASLEPGEPQGKPIDDASGEGGKRVRRRSPSPERQPTGAQIEKILKLDAGESPLLKFLDSAKARGDKPAAKYLVALATGDMVTAPVIDCYLKMLCDFVNARVDPKGESARSPKWYAFSGGTLRNVTSGEAPKVNWPPAGFPEARFQETAHHLFPIRMEKEEQWGVAVLSNVGGWRLDWYSSLAGNKEHFDARWPAIAGWLATKFTNTGIDGVESSDPAQPRQKKPLDSGVLMLGVARWLTMGWPLSTLGEESVPALRRLIAGEIDMGRLVMNE